MFYCRLVSTTVIYIFQVFYVLTHINGKPIKYLKPFPKKFLITVLSCFAQRVDEKFVVAIARSDGIVTRRTICSVIDGTTRTIQRKPNLCHIVINIVIFIYRFVRRRRYYVCVSIRPVIDYGRCTSKSSTAQRSSNRNGKRHISTAS